MPGKTGCRLRQWPGQFGVSPRILRVAVMRQVEMAKPGRRQEHQQPDPVSGRAVQPGAAEGRSMRGLVLQAEQKGQQDAVRQKQQRPAGRLDRYCRSGQPERRQMARELGEALAVGALQQAPTPVAPDTAQNVPPVRGAARTGGKAGAGVDTGYRE